MDQNNKGYLVSGEVFTFAEPGQGMYRILLSFLIIILSWLHFRSSVLTTNVYPRREFAVDVIITMSYMTLFLFVDAATTYYATVAVIWLLYALARAMAGLTSFKHTIFGLVFVGLFTAITISSVIWVGYAAEWSRLVLLTIGIVAYRSLGRKLAG
jgi:hypothetical protein